MDLSRRLAAFGVLLSLLLSVPALAQEDDEGDGNEHAPMRQAMQGGGMTEDSELDDARARVHFRTATELYDRGAFEDAAREFEQAYRLSRRPELLYNAYIAYREANERREAERMLAEYLAIAPDLEDRANLQARLEELREAIAEEEAREAALLEAEARAEEEARRAAIASELAERSQRREPQAWPWVVLGIGGAAVLAGAITGIVAQLEADELRSECPSDRCPADTNFESRRDNIRVLAGVTDGLLFGGAAVAVAGFVLVLALAFPSGPPEDDGPVEIPPVSFGCGPQGCGLQVQGTF